MSKLPALRKIVAERFQELRRQGIDIRAWGGHGDHYQILYTGPGQLTDEMVEPFLLFGPETVRFEFRPPEDFMYGPEPPSCGAW
jgi:hypothetical protein